MLLALLSSTSSPLIWLILLLLLIAQLNITPNFVVVSIFCQKYSAIHRTTAGCPEKKWLSECCWSPKIQNWVLRGQETTKNIISRHRFVQVWLRGVPATGDWEGALWLQQLLKETFFGTPCSYPKHCKCLVGNENIIANLGYLFSFDMSPVFFGTI